VLVGEILADQRDFPFRMIKREPRIQEFVVRPQTGLEYAIDFHQVVGAIAVADVGVVEGADDFPICLQGLGPGDRAVFGPVGNLEYRIAGALRGICARFGDLGVLISKPRRQLQLRNGPRVKLKLAPLALGCPGVGEVLEAARVLINLFRLEKRGFFYYTPDAATQ